MPKLRNSTTDLGALVQWIGRKCRNHNPLSELKKSKFERGKLPRMYQAQGEAGVEIIADEPNILVYAEAGKVFEIVVNEVEPQKYKTREKIAVGF